MGKSPSEAFILSLMILAITAGCTGMHDRMHSNRVDILQNGTQFDVYSNPRCSHLANLFRQNSDFSVRGSLYFVGGSYKKKITYARIDDPAYLYFSGVMLQSCIMYELREISPEAYSEQVSNAANLYVLGVNTAPRSTSPQADEHLPAEE